MHQLPMEFAAPMERTGYQAAAHQAPAAVGVGSRTLELDQRQREGRHMQEEGALPTTLEEAGQHQQTAEHPAELELCRPDTPVHSMLHAHQGLTWEASDRWSVPPHGAYRAYALDLTCHQPYHRYQAGHAADRACPDHHHDGHKHHCWGAYA